MPYHLVLVMSSEAKRLRPKLLPFLGLHTHPHKMISLQGLSPTHQHAAHSCFNEKIDSSFLCVNLYSEIISVEDAHTVCVAGGVTLD